MDPRWADPPPLLEMGATFLQHRLVRPFARRPFLPTTLLIYVTYRCHARCAMCGIWRESPGLPAETELSVEEIGRILTDRLFEKIEYLNLNGGEPVLREDLAEICQASVERLPRLKQVSLGTSGLLPERIATEVEKILPVLASRGVVLSVCLSIHGTGELLERMYGVRDAEARISRSLALLRPLRDRHGFRLHASCVLTDANREGVDDLAAYAKEQDVPVHFFVGEARERFRNLEGAPASRLLVAKENAPGVARLLRRLADEPTAGAHHAYRYLALAEMLERGIPRRLACHYEMGGLILGSRGELFYCPQSRAVGNCRETPASSIYFSEENLRHRRELTARTCPICPPRTFNRVEAQKDALGFARFLLARKLRRGEP